MDTNTIVFMGRPGSGKGTQAKRIAAHFGYDYFGTGALFRELKAEDSMLGRKVASTIDEGHLMPHWFASHLVVDKLVTTPLETGIVFDGSNRTLAEAELFFEVATWLGRPYRVICLAVSEETIAKRIQLRGEESGRPEDALAVLKTRIEEYDRETKPALAYLQTLELVTEVNGEQSIEDLDAELIKILTAPK